VDILEAMKRIELQAARGRAAFDEDELAQNRHHPLDRDHW
jgi:hypothetical protein